MWLTGAVCCVSSVAGLTAAPLPGRARGLGLTEEVNGSLQMALADEPVGSHSIADEFNVNQHGCSATHQQSANQHKLQKDKNLKY